jgi:3-hydroxybutyrate dehydrogenase
MTAGKTAIVTGSTSGIGLGMAEALCKADANVMLNGFGDPDEIEATRSRLSRENGVGVGFHGADMTKPDEIGALFRAADEQFGQVDIIVNNAGIQHVAPVEEFPPKSGTPSSPSISPAPFISPAMPFPA